MNPTLALGLDGGGTRTRAVVESPEGLLIGHGESGPSNPLSAGFADARDHAILAATAALRDARRSPRDVASIALGAAGLADPSLRDRMAKALARAFPRASVRVYGDADLALAATGSSANAPRVVAVIAGTGSIAVARAANGAVVRAGGYGFRIGDEGSGAWIAREALAAAQRALDGRGRRTRLVAAFCAALRCDESGLRVAAHEAAESASRLASLAPVVGELASAGDHTAREILRDAGARLADLSACVMRRAGLRRSRAPVSLSRFGGIFEKMPFVNDSFETRLRTLTGTTPLPPRVRAEVAAIELARLDAAAAGARR